MQIASFGASDVSSETTNAAPLNAFFPKEVNALIPTLSMLPQEEEVTMLEAEGLAVAGDVTHTDPLFSMPPLATATELVPDDEEEEEEEEGQQGEGEDKMFSGGNMKRHVL